MTSTTSITTSQKADNSPAGLALHLPRNWRKLSLPQKVAATKLVKQGMEANTAADVVLDTYPAATAINAATAIKPSSKNVAGSWQPTARDHRSRLVWLWNDGYASRAGAQAMASAHIRAAQAQAETGQQSKIED